MKYTLLFLILIAFTTDSKAQAVEYEVEKVNCYNNETSTKVNFTIQCPNACSVLVGNKNKSGKWKYLTTVHSNEQGIAKYQATGLKVGETFEYRFFSYPYKGSIDRLKVDDAKYKPKSVYVTRRCKN